MKKKVFALPIALLCLFGLVACDDSTSSSVSSSSASSSTTSSITSSSSESHVVADKNYTSITINNKTELTAEWHLRDSSRELSLTVSPDGNPTILINEGSLVVTSSDTNVITVSGKGIYAVGAGNATVTVTIYNNDGTTVSDSVALTVLPYVIGGESLKTVREKITDGTYKENSVVEFSGYITATMAESDISDGVYVQDGDYALMLYAGNLDTAWADGELKIGDLVHVKGTLSPYNGLNEVKPTIVEKVTADVLEDSKLPVPTTPTALEINDDTDFSKEGLAGQDGRLFTIKNAKYKSGTVNVGDHSNVIFTVGDTDVTFRVNYHLGKSDMHMMKGIVDSLETGDEVNLYGVIGWYNGPQLSPQILSNRTAYDCVEPIEELVNPTAMTISGPTKVIAGNSITLDAQLTPANSNQAVTWTSSNPDAATVDQYSGVVSGVDVGTTTITATSLINSSVKATYNVTVSLDPTISRPVTTAPEDGGTYLYALSQTKLEKTLYLTGKESGNYLASTDDKYAAAKVTANQVEGGWTLAFGEKQYLAMEQKVNGDKTYTNAIISEEPFTLTYNADLNTFTHTFGDTEYYIGTYNDFDTFSCSAVSYAATSFVSHLYTVPERPELEGIKIVSTEEEYRAGKEYTLTYEGAPHGALLPEDIGEPTWTSSDTSVATIADGKLSCLKAGKTTITLKVGEYTDTLDITVSSSFEGTPTTITFNEEMLSSGFSTITSDKAEKTTDSGIVFTLEKASNTNGIAISKDDPNSLQYTSELRVYKGMTFTITAPKDKQITAMEVTSPSGNKFNATNVGVTVPETGAVVEEDLLTLENATSTITLEALNQFRLNSVIVYLK